MLKSGDWGNFSLRCDEAKTLQNRSLAANVRAGDTLPHCPSTAAIGVSQPDKRDSTIGLARFKVAQGDYARAKEIADLCNLSYETIGLREDGKAPLLSLEYLRAS